MTQSIFNLMQDLVIAVVRLITDPAFLFGMLTGFTALSITTGDSKLILYAGGSGILFLLSLAVRVTKK